MGFLLVRKFRATLKHKSELALGGNAIKSCSSVFEAGCLTHGD
jgi:hypothetical protein